MLPLEGVGVYVDVRSSDGKANYSKCVSEQLQILGADIKTTLTNQCSHVVFKDGKVNTRILANKLGVTFVNVLWVERCRESNSRCNETDFPVTEERVETPITLRKTKPRYRSMQPAANLEASKGKKKRAKRDSSVAASDSPAPLNPLKRLNRKLQWPPDHSDVCSEAELAAHDEITEDMKQVKTKGKRKLKRSTVFNDSATEKSQCKKSISATDLFVLAKTPATSKKHTSCNSAHETKDSVQDEDSLLSLYDASQHFERKDYSVTDMINRIDETIDTFDGQSPKGEFDDLYSDSDPDFFTSPNSKLKRKCELTNSQTNIMNSNFDFDEVDSEVPKKKPKATRKRKQSKTNTKIENKSPIYEKERSAGSVLDSSDKLLTFNSNFTDASDIVTELEAGAGREENLVIDHIKSPLIVKESKRKSSRKSNYGTKTKKPHLPVQVAIKSKPKVIDEEVDELPSFGLLDDDSPPLLIAPPDDNDSPSLLIPPNGDESPPLLIPPEITNCTINDLKKDEVRQSRKSISTTKGGHISEEVTNTVKTATKDQITLLQEHTISSTSEGKENVSQNSRRRISQRIRNTSSLLNNPDFVYTHKGNIQSSDSKVKREPSIASIPEETRVKSTSKRSSKRESNRSDLREGDVCETLKAKVPKVRDVPVDTKTEKRRSSRQCRSNIRLSEISDKTDTSKIKIKPEINETPSRDKYIPRDKTIPHDQSITSELSTTETPSMRKPVKTLKKREIKRPVNVATTTDTEGSSSELNSKHGRRLKKTKKSVTESLDVSKLAPPRQSMSPMKKICTTCCHRDDQGMVRNTAKMLSATISEAVTPDTTHVVVGTVKRTINLLKGILHGSHVVSLSWVTESISSGSWQKETKYTLVKEFPVLKKGGEVRRGLASRLFAGIGLVFVEKHTAPPCAEITDLIELCGGKITKSRTRSKYCIGGAAQDKEHISLSEQWVLDTITKLKLQDSNQYLLFPYRSPSPEF